MTKVPSRRLRQESVSFAITNRAKNRLLKSETNQISPRASNPLQKEGNCSADVRRWGMWHCGSLASMHRPPQDSFWCQKLSVDVSIEVMWNGRKLPIYNIPSSCPVAVQRDTLAHSTITHISAHSRNPYERGLSRQIVLSLCLLYPQKWTLPLFFHHHKSCHFVSLQVKRSARAKSDRARCSLCARRRGGKRKRLPSFAPEMPLTARERASRWHDSRQRSLL